MCRKPYAISLLSIARDRPGPLVASSNLAANIASSRFASKEAGVSSPPISAIDRGLENGRKPQHDTRDRCAHRNERSYSRLITDEAQARREVANSRGLRVSDHVQEGSAPGSGWSDCGSEDLRGTTQLGSRFRKHKRAPPMGAPFYFQLVSEYTQEQ
jgi:hypothetical protein